MEANAFIAKLKADGSEKDVCDLDLVSLEYKSILAKLSTKDRGPFSLNVLCIFGRNLGKVPSWCSAIDSRALLAISIDCVRETRSLARVDRVKALACIYHLHKHAVKQNTQIPTELVLKISYMPFESDVDSLFKEHFKTYWNILIDRMMYIEKLKSRKVPVNKLLPRLTEDLEKVILIYDSVEFCSQILLYLVKKLYSIYNDVDPTYLNKAFEKIFDSLSKKEDLRTFKTLPENETLELYVKFNDCIYVTAENASKCKFKDCILNKVVRICINLIGHSPALLHCFQTFYLNSYCCLLKENMDLLITENIINSLPLTCESAEKLGYKKAMNATYPFLNQFLKLYIEYSVANCDRHHWLKIFTDSVQESCLKLILFLMDRLKNCKQLLKCENCKVQSGLHDSLRLSFLVKHFVSTSLAQKMVMTKILPSYYKVVLDQYNVLKELCSLGCSNYEKCYKKLQGDIHNTAILLNKSVDHEYPIKLFDIYLKNEIKHFRSEVELKNVSRALYNKSICELDFKLYEAALRDAYLSLVFAYPEALSSDKHMSLVMDIKAKASKEKNDVNGSEGATEEEDRDEFQMTTVFDIIMKAVDDNYYGNLKPFLCNLKFSILLKHEFSMYVKLWPSVLPVAGVWRSLYELSKKKNVKLLTAKDANIQDTLYGVVLETPTAVRAIKSEHFKKIATELLENFEKCPPTSPQLKLVHATLLFLKAEYDLAEASQKYEWKTNEPNLDPDAAQTMRTLRDECEAMSCAERAVHLCTRIVTSIETVPTTASTCHALQTAQVWVQHFLHAHRLPLGLQLAHTCCFLAKHVEDKQAYIRNAGTILYYADRPSQAVTGMIALASQWWIELMGQRDSMETALVFLSDSAMYYSRCGSLATAARLVRLAQAKILEAFDKHADVNLDLAVGRLLEAQALLCARCERGPGALTAAFGAQRHYLAVANTASNWCSRRLRSLTVKHHSCRAGVAAARLCRALLAWRRARAAAGAALPLAAAVPQAVLHAAITNTHTLDDAQVKIENRLKHILGLLSNETQPNYQTTKSKAEPVSPKQEIETMLENMTFRPAQTCPSSPRLFVPGFQTPHFLKHHSHCQCHNCQIPECLILTCQICGLQASMYYRAKEFEIARNHFEGTLKCLSLVERKLKDIMKSFRNKFEGYIVDIVDRSCSAELKVVKLEILIEAVYFELSQDENKMADEKIVQIHEILQESPEIDPYLRNEVFNLTTTSALVRKEQKKPEDSGLEIEMESLTISSSVEMPKTPEIKAVKPPKLPRPVAKDEELHKTKRRVIKLNLDDEEEQPPPRRTTRRALKLPVPKTSSPVLECLTPCVRKPNIIVTQPSQESAFDFPTPKVVFKSSTLFTVPTEVLNFDIQTPKPKVQSKMPKPGKTTTQTSEESLFEFATPKPKVEKRKPALLKQQSEGMFDFPTPRPKTSTRPSKNALNCDFATPKPQLDVEALKPIEDSAFDFTTPRPKVETKPDFFTPLETPSEQFFTPITSVKTYAKRSLRKNIVKNLESEFITTNVEIDKENSLMTENGSSDIASKSRSKGENFSPIAKNCNEAISSKPKGRSKSEVSRMAVAKEIPKTKSRTNKVETGYLKATKDKRSLKRATSPGKLHHEEKPEECRSTRLRQPVRFSFDDDNDEKK